jgi:SulP family sulfate permease
VAIALVGRALALLPLAALAGMLTLAGIQVLDPARIALVLRAGWPASLAFVLTLLATLSLPLHLAVLVGVASSALLHVYRSASAVSLRQVVADGAPAGSLVGVCERDPPPVLPSDAITALCPYGSLFFAAARALEEQLPRVGEARCPVVILLLRGQQDAGSTFLAVMVRYARRLRQAGGRLFVAGVSVDLRRQLDRTGTTAVIGEDAVFEATPRYGQSYLSARGAAEAWLAQGR